MDWKDHINRCSKDPIFEKKYAKRTLVGQLNKVKEELSNYEKYANEKGEELKVLELKLENLMEEYDALIRNEEHRQTHYRYGGKLSKKDLLKIEEESNAN